MIDVQQLGITGFEAERRLRHQFGIAPEMSDLRGVVCLITIGDTEERIDRQVTAFAVLAAGGRPARQASQNGYRSTGEIVAPGPQAFSPRDAFFARTRPVPLPAAVGEVAAELVVPYPPGIPVLAPGEVVAAAKVEYLREVVRLGGLVRGVADPSLRTLRIVAPEAARDSMRGAESLSGSPLTPRT